MNRHKLLQQDKVWINGEGEVVLINEITNVRYLENLGNFLYRINGYADSTLSAAVDKQLVDVELEGIGRDDWGYPVVPDWVYEKSPEGYEMEEWVAEWSGPWGVFN